MESPNSSLTVACDDTDVTRQVALLRAELQQTVETMTRVNVANKELARRLAASAKESTHLKDLNLAQRLLLQEQCQQSQSYNDELEALYTKLKSRQIAISKLRLELKTEKEKCNSLKAESGRDKEGVARRNCGVEATPEPTARNHSCKENKIGEQQSKVPKKEDDHWEKELRRLEKWASEKVKDLSEAQNAKCEKYCRRLAELEGSLVPLRVELEEVKQAAQVSRDQQSLEVARLKDELDRHKQAIKVLKEPLNLALSLVAEIEEGG